MFLVIIFLPFFMVLDREFTHYMFILIYLFSHLFMKCNNIYIYYIYNVIIENYSMKMLENCVYINVTSHFVALYVNV